MTKHALIVGRPRIAGCNLAENLLAEGGWSVSGLSRSDSPLAGAQTLRCDLLDPGSVRDALSCVEPSHVFITAWALQEPEDENCTVNDMGRSRRLGFMNYQDTTSPSRMLSIA